MKIPLAGAVALLMVALLAGACSEKTVVERPPVTAPVIAIDILLEPDAAMLARARAVNSRLLEVYPDGFPLDEAHRPHITLLQRFVRTGDLDRVHAAVGKVVADAEVRGMRLEAVRYGYTPGGEVGVAGIFVRPTPDLLRLQQSLIAAVAPYTVETGPIGAFTAPHDDPATDAALIGYVTTFVPKATGENYQPHVSTGAAPAAYLDTMAAEAFEPFAFSPQGAAIYQLGPFGTAAKKLTAWETAPR